MTAPSTSPWSKPVFLAILVALGACSGSRAPEVPDGLPPQSLSPIGSPGSQAETEVSPSDEVRPSDEKVSALDLAEPVNDEEAAKKKRAASVIVLSPEAPPEAEVTPEGQRAQLLDASRRETERRRSAAAPVAVINDENLAEMAEGGRLTVATRPASDDRAVTPEAAGGPKDELAWRKRARELRQRWHDLEQEKIELDRDAAGLRQRFYAEDDPFVRDGTIKPEWDRVLDRQRTVRDDIKTAQQDLLAFLEAGRRAGALPGWLREGSELEPRPAQPAAGLPTTDPREPTIVGENPP